MRKWFLVSLTALMVFCAAPEAKAQNWPAQPITLINGFLQVAAPISSPVFSLKNCVMRWANPSRLKTAPAPMG